MDFEKLHHLWLLVIIPFFFCFSLWSYQRVNSWIYAFTRKKKSLIHFLLHEVFLSLTCLAIIVALAGPKVQYEKTIFNRSGIAVVMGIDVSKSMLAEDEVLPTEGKKLFRIANRLNKARYFCLETISLLQGEWLGAYIFARSAVEVVPFTRDYGYARYMLEHINDAEITEPGSDLGEAIRTGVSMLGDTMQKRGVKILVLITDGEDTNLDKSGLSEAMKIAVSKGITVYTVGVGMSREVLIPIRSNDGLTIEDYYLDEDGRYLKTRLNQDILTEIAGMTGGKYFQLNKEDVPRRLIESIIEGAKTYEETKSHELAWFDLSPVFLFCSISLFIVALFFDH